MLGKRGRPPMQRTTSMTEFTLDFYAANNGVNPTPTASSRRPNRRNSCDFLETTSFLKACAFCKRRLVPGRDIYMYRGDTAFCSFECRHQQMTQDERKDKCSLVAKTEIVADGGAQVSVVVETAAAV